MWLFRKKTYSSDEDLVKAYKVNGNEKAFGELFEKHVRTVYGACLFYFKNKHEAQDATMQIFEKLLSELKHSNIVNFKGWLSFVVRNHCISLLRKNKKHIKYEEYYHEFEFEKTDAYIEQELETISNDTLLANLKDYIGLLKENQRICVRQFYLENKSYQDISELNGFSINEVKSYIQNGKRNLKLIILEISKHDAA